MAGFHHERKTRFPPAVSRVNDSCHYRDTASFSPAVQLLHGRPLEKMELVYLVEREPGKRECLTPVEFQQLVAAANVKAGQNR